MTIPQPFGFCANCYTVGAFEPAVCLVIGISLCGACTKAAITPAVTQVLSNALKNVPRKPDTNRPT